jgi:hypothetical protein
MASQGIDPIDGKIWISILTATAGLKKPQPGAVIPGKFENTSNG